MGYYSLCYSMGYCSLCYRIKENTHRYKIVTMVGLFQCAEYEILFSKLAEYDIMMW